MELLATYEVPVSQPTSKRNLIQSDVLDKERSSGHGPQDAGTSEEEAERDREGAREARRELGARLCMALALCGVTCICIVSRHSSEGGLPRHAHVHVAVEFQLPLRVCALCGGNLVGTTLAPIELPCSNDR